MDSLLQPNLVGRGLHTILHHVLSLLDRVDEMNECSHAVMSKPAFVISKVIY